MNKKECQYQQQEEAVSTTDTDKDSLLDHRVKSFETIGFSTKDSKSLAETKYTSYIGDRAYDFPLSWHKVKKMLDNGCSHELALKILL